MTLEAYYIAKDKLQAPDGLDAFQRKEWYSEQIQNLQRELNNDDLNVVLEEQRNWQQKLQSAHV